MGDIEGMFHQVKIPATDVDFLRFLWWPGGDTTQALRKFRMTVHLFGAVSSPSCANFALKQTAEDNEGKADSSALNTIRPISMWMTVLNQFQMKTKLLVWFRT
jgi:hypothetical protein